MKRTLLAFFVLASAANAAIVGIWADPGVAYPPTSTTGYPLNSLADALYHLEDGQTLNPIQIDGLNYLAVESDVLPVPAVSVAAPDFHDSLPHVYEAPSPHHHHEPVTPEPQGWVLVFAGIGLMLVKIQRGKSLRNSA